jgi:hypothetical protein
MRFIEDKTGKKFMGYEDANGRHLYHDTPAPKDEALDEFIINCADAVILFKSLEPRTVSLRPTGGRYNELLLDRIRLWVEKGNLRDRMQVNKAMSEHAQYLDSLIAFGAHPKDYQIHQWNLSQLDWYFRVPDAKEPPTRREVEANRVRIQQEQERQAAQAKAENARLQREMDEAQRVFDASPEGRRKKRVDRTLALIVPLPRVNDIQDESLKTNLLQIHADSANSIRPEIERIVEFSEMRPGELARRWRQADEVTSAAVRIAMDAGIDPSKLADPEIATGNELYERVTEVTEMRLHLAQLTARPAPPKTGRRLRFETDDAFFAALENSESELYKSLNTVGVNHTVGRDSNDGGRIYVDVVEE